MINRLISLLAPHRCTSCGEIGSILCESCKYDIVSETVEGCLLCRRPCNDRGLCQHCSRVLGCQQAWCVGEREGALLRLIDAYKFDSSRSAASVLAELLHVTLPVLPDGIVVVGIPTARATIRVRGFDHVGLVVRELARRRGLPVTSLLERQTAVTLHFLTRAERVKLGPTLFRLVEHQTIPDSVILVDDIVTTGTTLKAATKLLKQAGVQRIYLAVLARQPEHV